MSDKSRDRPTTITTTTTTITTKMTSKEKRFPTLSKRKGSVPGLLSRNALGRLERTFSKSSTDLPCDGPEQSKLSLSLETRTVRKDWSFNILAAPGSSQGSSDRSGRRVGRAKIPVTSRSTARFFIEHESEIIETSDVFANEDLEYIVQAERNQEPYFSSLCDNSEPQIRHEDEIAPTFDDEEIEMEPVDLFKSDIIVVDERKLLDRKSVLDGSKDNKIPTEKEGGNFLSRALKRAQSFGKSKSIRKKPEDKNNQNNHHYFTIRGRRKEDLAKRTTIKEAVKVGKPI